jgi:YHS domain-containing protein
MRWLASLILALAAGCAASDPRPTARDPVCLCNGDLGCVVVRVDEKTPKSIHKGKTYYFCAEGCRKAFDADPEKFVTVAEKDTGGK